MIILNKLKIYLKETSLFCFEMALRAPSLQSLLESDRESNDSLLAESLQLDINEVYLSTTSQLCKY